MNESGEVFDESSDEQSQDGDLQKDELEPLNPFMFELHYHTKKWEVMENFFREWLSQVPPHHQHISKLTVQVRKLRAFCKQAQEEHDQYETLRNAHEQLKYKMVNHDQLLDGMERGYKKQISEVSSTSAEQLREEILNRDKEIKTMKTRHSTEMQLMGTKLHERTEQVSELETEAARSRERQAQLQEQLQTCEKQLQTTLRELSNIKTLRTGGTLAPQSSKQASNFSSFELVIASKVKQNILQCLTLSETISLCGASKRLYFSIMSTNVIVPQAVFCKTMKMRKEIQMLSHQRAHMENLQTQSSNPILMAQIVKCYQMFYNPTDLMQGVLNDTSNLISGQLLGLSDPLIISTGYHSFVDDDKNELQQYLKQISGRATTCLNELKESSLKWSQFCAMLQKAEGDVKSIAKERTSMTNQIRMKAQEIQERLFTMGMVAAENTGLYGGYVTTMQRCLANLFTFGTQLVAEVKQLMGLVYFMAVQYWNILEKDKIIEDLMNRQKTDLQDLLVSRANLQDRIKHLDYLILQKDLEHRDTINALETERSKTLQLTVEIENNKGIINNYSSNVKKLVVNLKEQKTINKEIIEQYNQTVEQFGSLKSQVASVLTV